MNIPKPHLQQIGKAFLHEFVDAVADDKLSSIRRASQRITDVAILCEKILDAAVTKELRSLNLLPSEDDAMPSQPYHFTVNSLVEIDDIWSDELVMKSTTLKQDAFGSVKHIADALNSGYDYFCDTLNECALDILHDDHDYHTEANDDCDECKSEVTEAENELAGLNADYGASR